MIRDESGKIDWDAQNKLNCEHADNPCIGDFWEEHFLPIAVILGRPTPDSVLLCEETKRDPSDCRRLTWDFTKIKIEPVSAFAKRMRYSSIPNKCWADVSPECMPEVRDQAIAAMFGEIAKKAAPKQVAEE